ncbi:hypothetical protein ON010_g2440 [Phytophthora cinnamomi]|nr:hypothetical protein ON010_g2440 [Phytophthora cinnamomi]
MSSFASLLVVVIALLQLSIPARATQNDGESMREGGTTDWPSLRFHFKLKRSSMNIYGQDDFSVYANPLVSANGSRVLYDISATFREDATVYNYTLVNGVAYLLSSTQIAGSATSTVQYLSSELDDFPPINAIASALNDATPIPSVSRSARDSINCTAGNVYKASVSGFDFAVCAASNSGLMMYSRNVDIAVEYLASHVNIVPPRMHANQLRDCKAEVESSKVTSTGKTLLTRKLLAMNPSRKLAAEISLWFEHDTTCSCKSTPRPCIFIHGLGVENETPENEDSLTYWGDITNHAPCCTSIKYTHLNTINTTWMNVTQQQKVCDRALAVSNTSTDFLINDTILVTHSMGGLMLAGALANGLCALSSSSTWISTAAPMRGSMGSDYAQDTCAGRTNFLAETLAAYKNQCPVSTASKSVVYEDGSYSSVYLKVAYKAAQEAYRKNVSALMCSESFSGILSSYQASFWVLGHLIPHKSDKNDGVVEFQSCSTGIPASKFGNTYTDRFYRTKLNHYDMQFRAGDAFLNKAKMPLKWFECLL